MPDSLYFAAKVDGTSDMKYLFKVMVPICRPTLITIAILKVIECWNSYVWPRLITDDERYFLVSNGIQEIRENGFGRENIPAMMAAVVVISLPLIVLFLIFREKIMAGVSRGGQKGDKKKKTGFALVLVLFLMSAVLLTGCHGSRGLDAFSMPETFDESRNLEITFW